MKKPVLALLVAAVLPLSVWATETQEGPPLEETDPISNDDGFMVICRVDGNSPIDLFWCDDGRICQPPANTRHGTDSECHPSKTAPVSTTTPEEAP